MKNDKAHFVAFIGVMAALIFVLFLLEGTISFFAGSTPCILSLPVAVALCVYDDWKKSFIGGTLLGVSSAVFCLIFSSVFLLYANPLISVLPRVFIGIAAYWTYFALSKLCQRSKKAFVKETIPAAVAGAIGSITNTVLYLLATFIWRDWLSAGMGETAAETLWWVPVLYFFVEVVACAVLVPIYVRVLKKVNHTLINKNKVQSAEENSGATGSENLESGSKF